MDPHEALPLEVWTMIFGWLDRVELARGVEKSCWTFLRLARLVHGTLRIDNALPPERWYRGFRGSQGYKLGRRFPEAYSEGLARVRAVELVQVSGPFDIIHWLPWEFRDAAELTLCENVSRQGLDRCLRAIGWKERARCNTDFSLPTQFTKLDSWPVLDWPAGDGYRETWMLPDLPTLRLSTALVDLTCRSGMPLELVAQGTVLDGKLCMTKLTNLRGLSATHSNSLAHLGNLARLAPSLRHLSINVGRNCASFYCQDLGLSSLQSLDITIECTRQSNTLCLLSRLVGLTRLRLLLLTDIWDDNTRTHGFDHLNALARLTSLHHLTVHAFWNDLGRVDHTSVDESFWDSTTNLGYGKLFKGGLRLPLTNICGLAASSLTNLRSLHLEGDLSTEPESAWSLLPLGITASYLHVPRRPVKRVSPYCADGYLATCTVAAEENNGNWTPTPPPPPSTIRAETTTATDSKRRKVSWLSVRSDCV